MAKEHCLVRSMKDLTFQDPFKFMFCLNFEATCWENAQKTPDKKHEIIEFPVLLLNLANGEILDEFHEYVRPTEHPTLSEYCLNLTGITQEIVDAGILFADCLSKFKMWLECAIHRFNLVLPKRNCNDMAGNVTFCSWTAWDTHYLYRECKRKEIPMLSCFGQWIDAKKIFNEHYNITENLLYTAALKHVGLEFQGREHSGVDGANNLARLVYKMRQDGAVLKITVDYHPNLQVIESL